MKHAALFLILGFAAAQTKAPPAARKFSGISIRPEMARPLSVEPGNWPIRSITASGVTYPYTTRWQLLSDAFETYQGSASISWGQIEPPRDVILDARYSITATFPPGVGADALPELIESLLEDHFQMKSHKERKPTGFYSLVIDSKSVDQAGKRARLRKAQQKRALFVQLYANSFEQDVVLKEPNAPSQPPLILPKGTHANNPTVRYVMTDTPAALAAFLSERMHTYVRDDTRSSAVYDMVFDVKKPSGLAWERDGTLGNLGKNEDWRRLVSYFVEAINSIGFRLDLRQQPMTRIVVDRLETVLTP